MAREDPGAFTLLWRYAAGEPQFAAYASELRAISVNVVRQLTGLDSGDELFDTWRAEALFGWLVEATLTWLERGDHGRDEEFVQQTSAGLGPCVMPLRRPAPDALSFVRGRLGSSLGAMRAKARENQRHLFPHAGRAVTLAWRFGSHSRCVSVG